MNLPIERENPLVEAAYDAIARMERDTRELPWPPGFTPTVRAAMARRLRALPDTPLLVMHIGMFGAINGLMDLSPEPRSEPAKDS